MALYVRAMRRTSLAWVVLLFTGSSACCAQRPSLAQIPVGTDVRITLQNGSRIVATLLAPPDSVVTYGSGGVALTTRLSAVRRVEVRAQSAKRGLVWGALVGGLVASGAWAAYAKGRCEPGTCGGALVRAAIEAAPLGVAYGGVTGSVIGAYTESWSRRWP
jgi:hypothetical protein